LRLLQTIIFQIVQDKYKHGLCIFKYLVFVCTCWADTLFAGYGVSGNILVPLNLKIEEKPIETRYRKTRSGQKLRFIALNLS
jgi:hypothetical protein